MNQHLGKRLGRPFALIAALLTLALTLATPGIGMSTAQAAVRTPSHTVIKTDVGRMTSYVYGTTTRGRHVVGTFKPRTFVVRNGKMRAIGKLVVVTRGPGRDRKLTKYGVSMPVKRGSVSFPLTTSPSGGKVPGLAAPAGSCQILDLVLGPLDLNLLGLNVHLDRVVLNIFATPGPGALLGNLLCAVAGLLDGSPLAGLLGQLSQLLNQILGTLRAG